MLAINTGVEATHQIYAHKGQGPYLISVGLPVRARCPCRGSLGFLNVTALDTAASTGLSNPRKKRAIAISIIFCTKFSLNKARQTRFTASHQRPISLRPAVSTVIIAFQAVTHPLLMVVDLLSVYSTC